MSSTQMHELEIGATPKELWEQLTVAENITRWFAPVARVHPGAGGSIFLSWGEGMEGEAPIHLWEPYRRFGWTEGAKRIEFELTPLGACTKLRLTHSGVDGENQTLNGGWRAFLSALDFSLKTHRSAVCESLASFAVLDSSRAPLVQKLETLLAFAPAPDALSSGAGYQAKLGVLGAIHGQRLEPALAGYYLLTVTEWNDSMFGIFVEEFGAKCYVTFQCNLFGAAVANAAALRTELPLLLQSLE